MKINYQTRQEIAQQIKKEIDFARQYKKGKTSGWRKTELMYFGNKAQVETSRTNVNLNRMQEFVHTLLSKIDNPLTFNFVKRKPAQALRVQMLNALKTIDANNDDWDIKDIVGKKQAIMYGRAIYTYFADSVDGTYKPHLENVDVYDFLIDPSVKGTDIETAMYMGNYGVVKTEEELKRGIKDKIYYKTETERLIESGGNADTLTPEEIDKQSRIRNTQVTDTQKNISKGGKYVFWNWVTTYKGERYYALVEGSSYECIEITPLEEKFVANLFPYWSWASFLDLTEFWTPSYCDYIRETLMAQQISVNQLLDNAEQINKPQRAISIGMIEDLSELKYKKDGVIRVKGEFDVNKAYQTIQTPSINTPIQVYNLLEQIWRSASGVTAGDAGMAENDSGAKVAIYEGNQANSADKFGLLNKSYSFGYKRFAKLYENGVKEHLTKKVAIDMIGTDGIEQRQVSRRDLFKKGDDYSVIVESTNAELALSNVDRKNKLMFLAQNGANPIQNPKKAYELQASIAGFNEEEIRQLIESREFGGEKIMSEAERDIESVLENKYTKPNSGATTAYKQRFVDYFINNEENMNEEQKVRFIQYIESLDEIVISNMARLANNTITQSMIGAFNNPATPIQHQQTQQPQIDLGQGVGQDINQPYL